ncbi:MAG: hypothetical protein M3Y87_30380 [Myxococcota bacterium]|nr:hypothetical protein [Myxococcota bacterium]
MTAFGTYLIGTILLIAGLAGGAFLLGAPGVWILVGAVVLLGAGVMMATLRTKRRDE